MDFESLFSKSVFDKNRPALSVPPAADTLSIGKTGSESRRSLRSDKGWVPVNGPLCQVGQPVV